jgi:hypothetical protein
MKTLFCLLLLSFRSLAQEPLIDQYQLEVRKPSLPVYYYPFYNGVQIIEIDYYSQSLEQGVINDDLYPHSGSYLHDAMMFDRPNTFLVRSVTGEIISMYGIIILQAMELDSPDSCKTITHLERLNSVLNQGHMVFGKVVKERSGYGYQISKSFTPEQRTEMPEMSFQLYGVLDTLGNIAIPINHHSIDYAHGEYMVERSLVQSYGRGIKPVSKANGCKRNANLFKPYAIYDSTFKLTLEGTEVRLKRIAKNLYAGLMQGSVSFMDQCGKQIHANNYQSIRAPSYSDLIIYSEYKNDTLFQGLLSRQLEEVTPAIYSSIVSFEHGFMVRDGQLRNGYLNLQGKDIVPFELEAVSIDYRRDSFIVFMRYQDIPNGQMLCSGLMDTTGKVLLPPEYWRIEPFHNGVARVQKDNKWGFIDRSGELLCPIMYDATGAVYLNFLKVYKDGGLGLLDRAGKTILEANYAYIKWLDSTIHYGNKQGDHFIYNLKTEEKHKHSFGFLTPQANGLFFYKKADKFGLVDARGKLLILAKFDKIHAFRNKHAIVELNGKYGLIDESGEIVQPINFEGYRYDDDGRYVLK